ncbi:uncharacterized protein V6R79_015546 [Siganus canaliculatus]
MSGIMKVFLLLAVVVCISHAELNEAGKRCLCEKVTRTMIPKTAVKNIQIHPATVFCNKVEIVVTHKNGNQFCLDPKMSIVKKLLANVMVKRSSTAATPTESSSTTGNTASTHIFNEAGKQCLCERVENKMIPKAEVKSIQIQPATVFCNKVEIVVTHKNGKQFCLDPKMSIVKKLRANVMSRRELLQLHQLSPAPPQETSLQLVSDPTQVIRSSDEPTKAP